LSFFVCKLLDEGDEVSGLVDVVSRVIFREVREMQSAETVTYEVGLLQLV
jgi:hypothetical protein